MNNFSKDYIQYSDKKVKQETKHLALYFTLHITLYVVLFFFLIFFAWYTVFISTHKFYVVTGVSMMPTLNGQISEELLYDNINEAQKLSYDAVYIDKMTAPKVYDIIVVNKASAKDSVIKRLMGVEGDYITIAKGVSESGGECFYFYRIPKGENLENFSDEDAKVLEDGTNGYRIYNYECLWTHYSSGSVSQSKQVEVNQQFITNSYEYNFYNNFLSGYGNPNSQYNYYVSDSGLIYVQIPEDKVFYMGDNRVFSTDCREKGFCEASYVEGRAEIILHNYSFSDRLFEVVKFYFKEMEKFFAR